MISRYDFAKKTQNDNKKQVLATLSLPTIADQEDDVYIITNSTDRLDTLAFRFYGDSRYWWVIAVANNMGRGTIAVGAGVQLRIPTNPSTVIEQLQTNNI